MDLGGGGAQSNGGGAGRTVRRDRGQASWTSRPLLCTISGGSSRDRVPGPGKAGRQCPGLCETRVLTEQPWSPAPVQLRNPVLPLAVSQARACCRGWPAPRGSQAPGPRAAPPPPPPPPWLLLVGTGGLQSGTAPGWVAGPGGPLHWARLTAPVFLPTDELEPVLQDGQRCVRARRSLAEGLSWGPFRGNIQSKASSPGQVQPVRSPGPSSPATSCRAESSPGHRPLLPRELSPGYTPAREHLPLCVRCVGDGDLRHWDQEGGKERRGGFLEEGFFTWALDG